MVSLEFKDDLPHAQHITFDPIIDIHGARQDPDLFINNLRVPVILDEGNLPPALRNYFYVF